MGGDMPEAQLSHGVSDGPWAGMLKAKPFGKTALGTLWHEDSSLKAPLLPVQH